jgi:hypothetical protein
MTSAGVPFIPNSRSLPCPCSRPASLRWSFASPYRSTKEPAGPWGPSWSSRTRRTCNWFAMQPLSTLQDGVRESGNPKALLHFSSCITWDYRLSTKHLWHLSCRSEKCPFGVALNPYSSMVYGLHENRLTLYAVRPMERVGVCGIGAPMIRCRHSCVRQSHTLSFSSPTSESGVRSRGET